VSFIDIENSNYFEKVTFEEVEHQLVEFNNDKFRSSIKKFLDSAEVLSSNETMNFNSIRKEIVDIERTPVFQVTKRL
jgi:hypothetical protein